MTGKTCVGDVRLGVLDIGFDLIAVGRKTVQLPPTFKTIGYTDRDGKTWLIEGTRREMLAELRRAGFEVAGKTIRDVHGQQWDAAAPGIDPEPIA